MRFEHEPVPWVGVVDARPVADGWAALTRDGSLLRVRVDLKGLKEPLELHLSPNERFAAVVERFGRFGQVFDLSNGGKTMILDRGDYHPETSVFPAAFFVHRGRTRLVHGTDWNRLDVSDPSTGEGLTSRVPPSFREGMPQPEHYLDYFHAGLSVSPDGQWIAEDGWIWHPLGELRVWSLARWLEENAWESEDGPSLRSLTQRVYFWDGPNCWVDERRLAFWGEGDEPNEMLPAIRIYDVEEARVVARFAGPDVSPAMPWVPGSARAGWIAFGGSLFAISPEKGTGIWDVATGELVHFEAGFAPRRFDRGRREFLSWDDGGTVLSRVVP